MVGIAWQPAQHPPESALMRTLEVDGAQLYDEVRGTGRYWS
jgi:hypothetical protein